MAPNFNDELKGLAAESKACAKILANLRDDSAYKEAQAPEKATMEALSVAAFESIAIFSSLVPGQWRSLMRSPLSGLSHDFHSPEARAALKGIDKKGFGHQSEFVKSLTLVTMSRPGAMEQLEAELAQRASSAKPAAKRKPSA